MKSLSQVNKLTKNAQRKSTSVLNPNKKYKYDVDFYILHDNAAFNILTRIFKMVSNSAMYILVYNVKMSQTMKIE